MNNLYTAVSLSLINRKRFVITTNDVNNLLIEFQSLILQQICQFDHENIGVIDLLQHTTIESLIEATTIKKTTNYGHDFVFKQIIIWKNLQKLSKSDQNQLFEFLLQIDNYDTNGKKNLNYCIINDQKIIKPDLLLIIPVLDLQYYKLKLNQYLKERFTFLINYYYDSSSSRQSIDDINKPDNYPQLIANLRLKLPQVYVAPDIKRYIYSLVIFTRQHRLCSLSPKETRLSTRSIDEIRLLAQALTLWMNQNQQKNLFVTPDIVKISMRRIGYWLVNWEYNDEFTSQSSPELYKRLYLTILVGDWYGSDYNCAEKYIKSFESKPCKNSPTGYTNKIIEEVLIKTRPPI